ncbi:MAG: Arsenate reductase [Candidatus Omnitrophica bacterium]|nr:Arsenate reductase [Candidatus Omnitrophota bacterium]
MAKLTLYEKPTCTTCRQVSTILKEAGIAYDSVRYIVEPLSRAKLKELIRKTGQPVKDFIRTKEESYKALGLAEKTLSDEQWIDLLTVHPELLQRPIAEKGDRAVLARPAERIREIL